jgi:hypothetical protein
MENAPGQSPSDDTKKNPDIADSMLPKPSGDWPFPTSATGGPVEPAPSPQPEQGASASTDPAPSDAGDPPPPAPAPTVEPERLPTRAEARQMFKERPGLASVFTDEGTLSRDEC